MLKSHSATSGHARHAFAPLSPDTTLGSALLDARDLAGGTFEALEDPERTPLTFDRLILAALILGRKLVGGTARGERIGILLPNVNGLPVTLFGLVFRGRVPVLLNFTAGVRNLVSAATTAQLSIIVTSRRFVDQGKLEDVMAALGENRRVIYLEDVRKRISTLDKLRGLVERRFARSIVKANGARGADPGVVLFTSGTEGSPKAVVLSHANLVSNAKQVLQHADGVIARGDVFFNPLPMFHSYGLTAGCLTGLLNGMKVVLYPSPLHYKQVPKLIGEVKATVLPCTDTFLQGYARAASADDLKTVKLVVAGAERIKDETRAMWAPYGTTIIEGYGATECAPVLACNVPSDNRSGTVGAFLPGIEWRLEPVEGITEGGRLAVRGPNVMAGYMLAEAPGVLVPPEGGWHDTGDIVTVSEDGYCAIKGRAKRFAKIGGEMVSLAAIETLASQLWPGATHVCVILPDPRKGEQVVLVTDKADAERAEFQAYAKAEGIPELWVPRAVLVVPAIPVLGSGKVDYAGAGRMAEDKRALI